MKTWSLVAAAALLAAPALAGVKDDSFKDATGGRVLRESIVVDASRDAVWRAFTTDDGFKWAAPAHITPGNGGLIEFGFKTPFKPGDPNNVKNRIDVYQPDELLVFHNEYVPGGAGGPFDPATFAMVRTLLSFEDAGAGRTKVTQTVVGFGDGAKFDQLYAHLHDGNAQYLTTLADSFGGK